MLKFFKQIRPLGWLLIALLVAAIVLMVVNCSGDKPDESNATPTPTRVTTPRLSNEMPADERALEREIDSLNAQRY